MASAEQSRVFTNGKSKFENISGQFRPGQASFYESIMTPSLSELNENYWTPDKIQTATRLMQALHTELVPYGVPPTPVFDKNQFRRLGEKDRMGGRAHGHSGLVFMSESTYQYFDHRLHTMAHEYTHTLSARVLRNGRLRRQGIQTPLHNRNERKVGPYLGPLWPLARPAVKAFTKTEGIHTGFQKISEAIVEKTSHRILANNFEWYKGFGSGSSYYSYIEIVDLICKRVAEVNPQYGAADDVYRLFEAAEFGNGRFLPLARAVESTYGKGSFANIMTAVESLPQWNEHKDYKYKAFYPVLEGKASLDDYVGTINFRP